MGFIRHQAFKIQVRPDCRVLATSKPAEHDAKASALSPKADIGGSISDLEPTMIA